MTTKAYLYDKESKEIICELTEELIYTELKNLMIKAFNGEDDIISTKINATGKRNIDIILKSNFVSPMTKFDVIQKRTRNSHNKNVQANRHCRCKYCRNSQELPEGFLMPSGMVTNNKLEVTQVEDSRGTEVLPDRNLGELDSLVLLEDENYF